MRNLLTFFLFLNFAFVAHAETRAAFVVGNSDYENAARLANPVRDARLVGDTLASLGFDVTRHQDLTRESFAKALGAFLKTSRDADVTFFYFAGHGMQYDGQNYLVGTDAELISELDIEGETIALNKVVELLERNSKAALIFVDACRDNPLATDFYRRNFSETRALNTRGLARVRSRIDGSMLVFAAGPGQVAYDGDGRNSPFATALATHLPTEGKEILTLTKRIIGDVRDATDGRQSPIVTNDLTKEIFLREAALRPQGDAGQNTGAALEREKKVFEAAKRISSFRSWAQYFDAYPNGALNREALLEEAEMYRQELRHAVDYQLSNQSLDVRRRAMQQEALNVQDLDRKDAIAIQALLKIRGFDPGDIDGQLGQQSFAAISEFQLAEGLKADGILDRATIAALGVKPLEGTEASRFKVSSIWGKFHRVDDIELLESDPRILSLAKQFGSQPAIFGFRDGHAYMALYNGSGWRNWAAANELAELAGGHFTTITSREENEFVLEMVRHDPRFWIVRENWTSGPTIGLIQKPKSIEPAGGWVWVTGEPTTFLNWDRNAPNNHQGVASVARFGHPNPRVDKHWVTQRRLGTWDDTLTVQRSLVVEISE